MIKEYYGRDRLKHLTLINFKMIPTETFSLGSDERPVSKLQGGSEKNVNEIRKINKEMIWKTHECRTERIKETMEFEKIGRMLALDDTTERGFGDDV